MRFAHFYRSQAQRMLLRAQSTKIEDFSKDPDEQIFSRRLKELRQVQILFMNTNNLYVPKLEKWSSSMIINIFFIFTLFDSDI